MSYVVQPTLSEGDRTKQRILECALDLFGSAGYEASSLRQLAERLDVTAAALYYHFSSKAEILAAVVAPLLSSIDAALDDVTGDKRTATPRELLERVVDAFAGHRAILALLISDVSAASQPIVQERLRQQNRRLADALAGDAPDTVQRICVAAALGALRRPLIDLPDVDVENHRDAIVESALGALNPPSVFTKP